MDDVCVSNQMESESRTCDGLSTNVTSIRNARLLVLSAHSFSSFFETKQTQTCNAIRNRLALPLLMGSGYEIATLQAQSFCQVCAVRTKTEGTRLEIRSLLFRQ